MKKIINDWEVLTPDGWSSFDSIQQSTHKKSIILYFSDNSIINCTKNHKIKVTEKIFKLANKLNIGDKIFNNLTIIDKKTIQKNDNFYDLINVKKNNQYITNNIISHNCAHIDDFKAHEFFASILPVISSSKNTKIFMVSTPNGTNNHFYHTYSKAINKENSYIAHKIHWKDIPGRDSAWRKTALDDVNGDLSLFRQEYENCFVESGESAIDKELLLDLKSNCKIPEILNTQEYKVWEAPDSKKIYAIGVDVSDGVGGAASVIQGFDITDLTNIKQVFIYANRYIDTTNFTKEIFNIAKQWGKPWLAIERNSMGGEVISTLMKHPFNYERLISYSNDKSIDYEKKGINSSTNAKYDGVSNMRYWVNVLKAVNIYDINTVQELETFVKYPNGTWKKQGGENVYDDRVMAMVWALFELFNPIAENIFEIVEKDDNGKPLKIKKDYYDDAIDVYVGLNQKLNDWGDSEFVPSFINVKQNENKNQEIDDLISDGWRLF